MEVLERMVSESFARYGVEPAFDYRRVQWSRWFRCADSLSVALVSSKPGVFALGEEIVAPAERRQTHARPVPDLRDR